MNGRLAQTCVFPRGDLLLFMLAQPVYSAFVNLAAFV